MELIASNEVFPQVINDNEVTKSSNGTHFIKANTKPVTLNHLKNDCVIPVFARDNESTISHFEFIDAVNELVRQQFPSEIINRPEIRCSHVIKGRTPYAIGIPAKELLAHQKTIYYERCAFIIEIPSITEIVNKNPLSLTIGGVRSYNEQNLYGRKTLERFKLFIGFKNMVCLNLCISSDGYADSIRVSSISDLAGYIKTLISSYNKKRHLGMMEKLSKYHLNEIQFAHLVGKLRMYANMPNTERSLLLQVELTDNQVSHIVKDYYKCPNFGVDDNGNIDLWSLYNLFTEANKSSYIDSNFNRNVSAYEFIQNLGISLKNSSPNWFLP